MAPLGPIRRIIHALGYEYWLDAKGNEYNSVKHVALCAVAKALEVGR